MSKLATAVIVGMLFAFIGFQQYVIRSNEYSIDRLAATVDKMIKVCVP